MKQVKEFKAVPKKEVKKFETLALELKRIKDEYESLNEELKVVKKKLMTFFKENELLNKDMKGVMSEDITCEVIYRKPSTVFDDEVMKAKATSTYESLLQNYGKTILDLELIKIKAPSTYKEITEKYTVTKQSESFTIGKVEDLR